MSNFISLETDLEGWFDHPFSDLPDPLKQRVDQEFSPLSWDDLQPGQRRDFAQQWDCQHDPAREEEREYWWDVTVRVNELKRRLEEWESVNAPTASELTEKERRVAEIKQELARLSRYQLEGKGFRRRHQREMHRKESTPSRTSSPPPFIPYPKAISRLTARLNATPDELAAWVWCGPEISGLTAFLNANELEPPPKFRYGEVTSGGFDYLSPLMACWFSEHDIENFNPADRYITGAALIERWKEQPGIQPEAFIRAKIAESRLQDIHPITNSTPGLSADDDTHPPLERGLFELSRVEKIEEEDFSIDPTPSSRNLETRLTIEDDNLSTAFKPLPISGIAQIFTLHRKEHNNLSKWKSYAENATRNGLINARVCVGRGKAESTFDLWKVGEWLIEKGYYSRDQANRKLANNLPPEHAYLKDFFLS